MMSLSHSHSYKVVLVLVMARDTCGFACFRGTCLHYGLVMHVHFMLICYEGQQVPQC